MMPLQLMMGRRGGFLSDVSRQLGEPFQKPHLGRGLAIGDLDNDGRLDAIVVNQNEPLVYLHNTTERPGHFIRFSLEGTKSNRDGVGARVTITAGGRRLVSERIGGGSYQSASDPRLHFGLGTGIQVDSVAVQWPSGQVDHHGPLIADREYRLREGDKQTSVVISGAGGRESTRTGFIVPLVRAISASNRWPKSLWDEFLFFRSARNSETVPAASLGPNRARALAAASRVASAGAWSTSVEGALTVSPALAVPGCDSTQRHDDLAPPPPEEMSPGGISFSNLMRGGIASSAAEPNWASGARRRRSALWMARFDERSHAEIALPADGVPGAVCPRAWPPVDRAPESLPRPLYWSWSVSRGSFRAARKVGIAATRALPSSREEA